MALNPSKSMTTPATSAHAVGKPRQYDVAVIGGGIVGKACALGLAQQGFDVVQIAPDIDQQTPKPSGDQWAERIYAISPGTRSLLQSLQVWDAIDHTRLQVVRDMRIYGDRGEPNDGLHLSAFEAGVPQLAWIGESDLLEHTLEQACRFQSKLECAVGSLGNLFVEPDGALLKLDTAQSPIEVKANLVIAADGANSSLRSMLEIQTDEKSYEQRAVVANFLCTNAHLETAFQWFLPGGDILAMLPLPGKQVSMVWSTSPENAARLLTLDASQWQSEFAMLQDGAIVHALGTLSPHSKPGSFPLRKIRAQRVIGPELMPKVILIGDAAHVMHPLAGQGLNLGLRDVAALLRILRERESFRVITDPVLLRRYERERHGDTSAILWVTDRLKQLFTSANPLQKKIRNWGMGLVNHSHLIKRYLIKEALGEVK
jgi:ubiquinone biosynthesis UbiH/UbiF/VisC/COQ6 family hydroxylase